MQRFEYPAITNWFTRIVLNKVVRHLANKYHKYYQNNNLKGLAKIDQIQKFGKPKNIVVEQLTIGQMSALKVLPQKPDVAEEIIMLYCHGGGYIYGNDKDYSHQVNFYVNATGIPALVFDYGLAPKHPFPSAVKDAIAAYDYLIEAGYHPKNIIPIGDSAGGHLVISLLLHLKKKGAVLPQKAVAFYPWCDPKAQHDSIKYNSSKDSMLTEESITMMANLAFGTEENKEKYSLLNKELSGLPPILVQIGTHDCLYSENIELIEKLEAANNDGIAEIYYEMTHGWITFPDRLKEANLAIENFARFIKQ